MFNELRQYTSPSQEKERTNFFVETGHLPFTVYIRNTVLGELLNFYEVLVTQPFFSHHDSTLTSYEKFPSLNWKTIFFFFSVIEIKRKTWVYFE